MFRPYFTLKHSQPARKLLWALQEHRERFHDPLSAKVYMDIAKEQAAILIAAGC